MRKLFILLSFLAFLGSVTAQDAPATGSIARGATVYFNVVGKGQFTTSQFQVSVDGQPLHVGLPAIAQQPLYFVLLVDVSGSSQDKVAFEKSASVELFDSLLQTGYKGWFGTFNDELYLDTKTTDHDSAVRELKKSNFRGGTALYDAVMESSRRLHKLSPSPDARRTVIVLTDGEDNASTHSLSAAIKEAQQEGIAVLPIGILNDSSKKKTVPKLFTLSSETGGVPLFIGHPIKVATPVLQILGSQYALALPASFADGRAHRLKILIDNTQLQVYAPAEFLIAH